MFTSSFHFLKFSRYWNMREKHFCLCVGVHHTYCTWWLVRVCPPHLLHLMTCPRVSTTSTAPDDLSAAVYHTYCIWWLVRVCPTLLLHLMTCPRVSTTPTAPDDLSAAVHLTYCTWWLVCRCPPHLLHLMTCLQVSTTPTAPDDLSARRTSPRLPTSSRWLTVLRALHQFYLGIF